MGQKTPEVLENFQRCIFKGTSEPGPELVQAFREHLDEYYSLFDPIPANCIALCAMDFMNGCLLEEMPEIKGMKLTDASLSWPYFLRNKTGTAQAYAFMLFPKEVNVDMTTYIQVVEDIGLYVNLTNDILSFYKEHMAGERHNYIYNRAAATQRSIEETLRDVVQDAVQAHSRVTRVLESSGNKSALDIWGKFVNGLFGFHFALKRYRLQELESPTL
ncbi:terpenoid synthase [Agrocybe pediades]|nr:terpenoid synthase [Agrocybe pediades]